MDELTRALREGAGDFWQRFDVACHAARTFEEVIALASLRKRALARERSPRPPSERIAMIGGCTLSPLRDLVEVMLAAEHVEVEIHVGEYGTDRVEMIEPASVLHRFAPSVVVGVPAARPRMLAGLHTICSLHATCTRPLRSSWRAR